MSGCLPWEPDTSCLPPGWNPDPNLWTDLQKNSIKIAQSILTRCTAGKIGLCEIRLRPCRPRCAESYGFSGCCGTGVGAGNLGIGFMPVLFGGRVYNVSCGCSGPCGCGPICEIALPGRVNSVTQVKIDGVVLDPSQYTVQNNRYLVRRGTAEGPANPCWPECQRLDLPDSEPGTWSVTYLRGLWDEGTAAAARRFMTILGGELAATCEKRTCRLPSRVTNVARDGVTYSILDDPTIFDRCRTGLPEVDMWLGSINPNGSRSGLKVMSPDLRPQRRQTYPAL